MKEVIINPDNLNFEEVNNVVNKIYLIVKNSKNEILFYKNHNTYYFYHEFLAGSEEETLENIVKKFTAGKVNLSNVDLFLVRKIYTLDYPLIDDKTLFTSKYYIIDADLTLTRGGEYIGLAQAKNLIEANRYDNPRNQDVTNEILEVLNYIV